MMHSLIKNAYQLRMINSSHTSNVLCAVNNTQSLKTHNFIRHNSIEIYLRDSIIAEMYTHTKIWSTFGIRVRLFNIIQL